MNSKDNPIIVKLLKIKEKENILKPARNFLKSHLTRGRKNWMTVDFSYGTMKTKQNNIFQELLTSILYPAKTSFNNV